MGALNPLAYSVGEISVFERHLLSRVIQTMRSVMPERFRGGCAFGFCILALDNLAQFADISREFQ